MNGTGPETFGRWLDLTMANRDIKGRELSRKLKVHESAVSRWRAGNGVPSMDSCLRLAKFLNVEPIRLAVTAGLMDGDLIGVEPLPMPEATAQRSAVRSQLDKIRGLTKGERDALLSAYDEMKAGAQGS
jgi:transcriptional regulator with XRE-family HTH domain